MKEQQSQKKIESLKSKKKLRVFLLFLALSFFFWMLIKLQEEYIADVNFKLKFTDLPGKKLLQSAPQDEVKLTIKTEGFNLLKYRIKGKVLECPLNDVEKKNKNIYFLKTGSILKVIQAQFPAETVVLEAKPDTLFFDFGSKSTKKVKVIPVMKLQFKPGFNLVRDYTVEPTEISISGPQGILDSIHMVTTDVTEIKDISGNFEKKVTLLVPDEKVSLSVGQITVKGEVDKFTEGSFKLPIEVINVPRKSKISPYPKEVKIIFKVPISDYNKVLKESFRVICDYRESQDNKLDYLIPKLSEKPDMISSVRIVPAKIEYLIKKN